MLQMKLAIWEWVSAGMNLGVPQLAIIIFTVMIAAVFFPFARGSRNWTASATCWREGKDKTG